MSSSSNGPQFRLLAAAANRARLSFYSPGLRQPAHQHHQAHISIIVAGSVRDISAHRDEIASASALTLRPCETNHRVEFGPQGALILSVDIADCTPAVTNSGWLHRDLFAAERSLLRWVLSESLVGERDVGECIEDLLAGIETERLRGAPPAWLIRAREQLMNDPANTRVAALAVAAAVHRAHFARAFQHWFAISPSVFRKRAMLSRAIAVVASGGNLSLGAHVAGFSDASHLCKVMRAVMGTTSRRLLHPNATFVQRERRLKRYA